MNSNRFTILLALLGLVATAASPQVLAATPRPVLETIEQLAKKCGKPLSRGAGEALERAFALHGDAVLRAARDGGADLAEVAARHGDEVWSFAARVPESGRLLVHRSDYLLPLARHFGDDFLRLEARVPGLAGDAFRIYGEGAEIRRLLRLPAEQARQVISYARHADTPATARLLLATVESGGTGFLGKLDKGRILALGLSSAMITAAAGVSFTAGDKIVQGVTTLAHEVWNWLRWVILAVACLAGLWGCLKLRMAVRGHRA